MKRLLPLGKLYNGLYYTLDKDLLLSQDDNATSNKARFANTISKDPTAHAKLLHLRLGLLPFSRLKIMYPTLDVKVVQENFLCSICPLARQSRVAFSHKHVTTNTLPFELLHVDVWGPYSKKTHSGCTLFLTVVDDYSRNTWLFLMHSKSQSVKMLQHLILHIET